MDDHNNTLCKSSVSELRSVPQKFLGGVMIAVQSALRLTIYKSQRLFLNHWLCVLQNTGIICVLFTKNTSAPCYTFENTELVQSRTRYSS